MIKKGNMPGFGYSFCVNLEEKTHMSLERVKT